MDLTHRLRLPAPPAEVWAVLTDPGRLAEVLPGALVDSAEDDTCTGTLKTKLGPSLLTLAGTARWTARDEAARRAVLRTQGADRRGDAGVEATHTVTLAAAARSASETEVTVRTTMTWTGRPARLGEGVVADALERVLDQAASRAAARVAEGLPWAPAAGTTHGARGVAAESVVDHPVELGADLGDLDAAPADPGRNASGGEQGRTASAPASTPGPTPRPSPGPSPRPPAGPAAQQYVYRPYDNAAEPHLDAVRTFGRVVVRRVLPYAGLGALAVFAAASAVRRVRR